MLICWPQSWSTSPHMCYSFYWPDSQVSKDDWRLDTIVKALDKEIEAHERATVLHNQSQGADQPRRFRLVQLCWLEAEMDHPAHTVTRRTTQTFAKWLYDCKQGNILFRNQEAAPTAFVKVTLKRNTLGLVSGRNHVEQIIWPFPIQSTAETLYWLNGVAAAVVMHK